MPMPASGPHAERDRAMRGAYGFSLFPTPLYRQARAGEWRVTAHLPGVAEGYVTRAAFDACHVLTRGREAWMSTGLMERESHAWHVHCAHGTVVAAGLGLGMYAFAASLKADVEMVVVAEISPEVIRVMRDAARFDDWPHRDKVSIVEADALAPEFADRILAATGGRRPDYLYADIWPGLPAEDAPAATAAIAHAIGAKAAGWWGQEVSFGLWCRLAARRPDENALRDYFAGVDVPVPVTAGYAAFCRDVMAVHGISPPAVDAEIRRLWKLCVNRAHALRDFSEPFSNGSVPSPYPSLRRFLFRAFHWPSITTRKRDGTPKGDA